MDGAVVIGIRSRASLASLCLLPALGGAILAAGASDPWSRFRFAMLGMSAMIGAVYAEAYRQPRADPLPDSVILKTFLQLNPEEGFDLETLNAVEIRALEREILRDKRMSRDVLAMTESLLVRVRYETENAVLAGAILRNKTLDWYRRSPTDPNWSERMAIRWGGIFHESRTPGGRLSTRLTDRLENLRMECAKASGLSGSLRHRLHRVAKRTRQPLMPQVAQAYLDDLTLLARRPEKPRGLERLSELARRIGPADVNIALAELFPREGVGPLIVLDPHYHPDEDTVVIRPPPGRASGEAVIYDLIQTKAPPPTHTGATAEAGTTADDASSSPWARPTLEKKEWIELLVDLQKRKTRMEAPPITDYQTRESYLSLRDIILADNSARKAFLAIHWKGRPSGLALLARALSEGNYSPEVETDGDYLEAELGRMAGDNPDSRPDEGKWLIGGGWNGWTVIREVAQGVRTYRAKRRFLD